MSEYKRIVSYLYKYERGKKGQNAGYVRIDVRQGSLKLLIHAQDEKALKDKNFQVYFYYHDKGALKGVLGGTLRFQKGEGRYRGETEENSIFDSGHPLDKMGGMLLYYNSDLAYGTEWDDEPIVIQKFEEEARKEEEPEQKVEVIPPLEREERDIRESKREEEEKVEPDKEQREKEEQEDIFREEEKEEIEQEQEVKLEEERAGEEEIALEEEIRESDPEAEEEEIRESDHEAEEEEIEPEQEMEEENNVIWKSSDRTPKNDWIPFYEEEMQEQDVMESSIPDIPEEDHLGNLEESFFDVPGLNIDQDTFLGLQAIYNGSSIGRTEDMSQYDFSELQSYPLNHKEKTSEELINDLFSQCPKVNHPTNHQIMLMVRIHPQDIGKLSISNWHFGSNSFLIHGYYQFHYIVIGRIMTLDGTMQSIIGVPGLYNNQEKYMALQFGFRDFLSVKPTQIKTGSFGYWIAKLS